MKTIILGAGGLLGRHCVQAFSSSVFAAPRVACDITRIHEIARIIRDFDLVVNCAAFTNADAAETQQRAARDVNTVGASNVALACKVSGATLVHVSTDSVFDGESEVPYDESASSRPISAYGQTKLDGEYEVRSLGGKKVYIVRVQGLYGDGGRNFASQIIGKICRGERFRVDCERLTQPTWARAAALQIARLVEECKPGMYHVSCSGVTTWAGFAQAVAEELKLPRTWQEVSTAALGLAAKRPRNCTFSHAALGDAFQMLDWRDTLRTYLENR